MEIFGDDWIAAAGAALAALPRRDGADAEIDYVIEGTPAGKVTLGVVLVDGRVTSLTAGKSAEPDLVVTMKYEAARKILAGEMTGDAGFMNGALKVEGAHRRWMLDLRPVRLAAIEALAPVMAETAS